MLLRFWNFFGCLIDRWKEAGTPCDFLHADRKWALREACPTVVTRGKRGRLQPIGTRLICLQLELIWFGITSCKFVKMIYIYLYSTVREKYVPFEKRKTTDTVKGIVGKFSVLVNIHVKLRSYKDIQYKFYCMVFFN